MKNSEIFYFDLDGTVLNNEDHTISPKTIKAINTLKELGYKVAICTGRTIAAVADTKMREIVEWDAYILTNGATILDKDFNVISNHIIDPQRIHDILNVYPYPIMLESEKMYLVNGTNELFEEVRDYYHFEITKIKKYENQDIPKITFSEMDTLEDGTHNPLFEGLTFERNSHKLYEFISDKAGKHNGIKELNKILGIKRHTFFGDGSNDVEALRHADFGVAMGNAVDDAKKVADYVTSSVNDDGIFNALKKYEII